MASKDMNTSELLSELSTDKKDLATNITSKGVASKSTDSFRTLVDNVAKIDTSGGDGKQDYFSDVSIVDGNYELTPPAGLTIHGVKDPVEDEDAVNKRYVDNLVIDDGNLDEGVTVIYLKKTSSN